jgi:aspartyl protease family protein
MGITVLKVGIANPGRPAKVRELEFLVDSGAIFSVVPKKILKELAIKPMAEQAFRLADGTEIVRKKGSAVFRYKDRVGTADVIFGEDGDFTLLGVLALESMGLGLDPLKRELIQVPMVLASLNG